MPCPVPRSLRAITLIAFAGLPACESVSVTAVDVSSIHVSPEQGELYSGDTLRMSVVAEDDKGNVLRDRPLSWSSDDEAVASVDAEGLVEAVGAGETRIRAFAGRVEGTATIHVTEGPLIQATPDAVEFDAMVGDVGTLSREVEITNGGGAVLEGLTLRIAYGNGHPGGWLQATLDAGEAPTKVRLVASVGSLSAGEYVAELEVRAETAERPGVVPVTLRVRPRAPSIGLSPSSLDFDWEEGRPLPAPATIQVTNEGDGSLEGLRATVAYGAGGSEGWLSASLSRSTAPAVLTVEVRAELPPGSYEAAVRVSASSDASNAPRTLPVRLDVLPGVSAARSEVSASPDAIPADGESTSTVTVRLRDPRGDPLTAGGHTVSLSTTRGSLGDVSDRGDGTYRAILTSSTATGTAVVTGRVEGETIGDDARVAFEAVEPPPSIGLSPGALDFAWEEGEPPPASRTVQVTNGGGGTLDGLQATVRYGTEGADGWLVAALDATTAPTALTVVVQPSGLLPGSYEATVQVSAPDVDNSPDSVTVRLEVRPGPSAAESEISADPDELEADGESTSTITVQLRDARGDPLSAGGHAVTLSTTLGTLGPVEDRGDGTYRATLTASTTPGTAVVTGQVNGETIGDDATVEIAEADDPPEP